jgi:hypothetical protein
VCVFFCENFSKSENNLICAELEKVLLGRLQVGGGPHEMEEKMDKLPNTGSQKSCFGMQLLKKKKSSLLFWILCQRI